MKLISWNINGLRAVIKKGFFQFVEEVQGDIICLQEIKATQEQVENLPEGYHVYWNSALRKGYSGTMTLSKIPALSVSRSMGIDLFDQEGRCLTTEFEDFYLVNIYSPNSQPQLARLDERMIWEVGLREYVNELQKNKPVLLCGDLNVAHKEIDIARPGPNRRSAGFTDEEREKMTELLEEATMVDTFRYFHKDVTGAYSWWSYFGKARENNVGWRIDYFLASESFKDRLTNAYILPEVTGSDHAPVVLEISK